ncbi:MAG: tRNA preQ1(34) S-adenosylmethionine ribosyltransferase-isomerase QueA [Firmicutes bacterium]|nr:tRNA preQ1(34) S-adenosylmethionine ribosyltransferase-isomerase QueA [Bacillota bacterium]
MKKEDFYYELDDSLIAQTPLEPRDHARLLHYNRQAETINNLQFFNLVDILQKGDVLVVNDTKVIPARIYGQKSDTKANIEFLLHKRLNLDEWEVLAKPGKRLKIGSRVNFSDKLYLEVLSDLDDGLKKIKFFYEGVFESILDQIGDMPLPHYIKYKLEKKDRYQTVYADDKKGGSSAAPTAGLHFTPELMQKLKDKGVEFVKVLLHVGLGTFRPVKTDKIEEHIMHSEYYQVTPESANKINEAKRAGRRIIAVGTTSVRTLESAADDSGIIHAGSGDTSIFIYPPYKFKAVDGLITNFHLPESTLIMLVSAFLTREKTLEIYNYAVKERYRFFSFGDSMLLL